MPAGAAPWPACWKPRSPRWSASAPPARGIVGGGRAPASASPATRWAPTSATRCWRAMPATPPSSPTAGARPLAVRPGRLLRRPAGGCRRRRQPPPPTTPCGRGSFLQPSPAHAGRRRPHRAPNLRHREFRMTDALHVHVSRPAAADPGRKLFRVKPPIWLAMLALLVACGDLPQPFRGRPGRRCGAARRPAGRPRGGAAADRAAGQRALRGARRGIPGRGAAHGGGAGGGRRAAAAGLARGRERAGARRCRGAALRAARPRWAGAGRGGCGAGAAPGLGESGGGAAGRDQPGGGAAHRGDDDAGGSGAEGQ